MSEKQLVIEEPNPNANMDTGAVLRITRAGEGLTKIFDYTDKETAYLASKGITQEMIQDAVSGADTKIGATRPFQDLLANLTG